MRIGVLCSGNGSNFENIVRTCKHDEVVVMIYNKSKCGAHKRADKLGIPNCYLKSENEFEIISLLQAWGVELVVLAGWMRVVSSNFINAFPDRIINIHPSLLPKYKGLHAIEQAMESEDKITGCTVHFVSEELDSGAVILQKAVPILENDTVKTLTRRIQLAEYEILPKAIDLLR
tara:strand:+ start:138 stop:662 length:525 start_codon:yes stop_codon:yes gene_type:complete